MHPIRVITAKTTWNAREATETILKSCWSDSGFWKTVDIAKRGPQFCSSCRFVKCNQSSVESINHRRLFTCFFIEENANIYAKNGNDRSSAMIPCHFCTQFFVSRFIKCKWQFLLAWFFSKFYLELDFFLWIFIEALSRNKIENYITGK